MVNGPSQNRIHFTFLTREGGCLSSVHHHLEHAWLLWHYCLPERLKLFPNFLQVGLRVQCRKEIDPVLNSLWRKGTSARDESAWLEGFADQSVAIGSMKVFGSFRSIAGSCVTLKAASISWSSSIRLWLDCVVSDYYGNGAFDSLVEHVKT